MSYDDWLDEVDAVAVTLVLGLTPKNIGDVLRVDWSTQEQRDLDEAFADQLNGRIGVQLDELGEWLAVIEPNGGLAVWPSALVPLSTAGRAVSFWWNVNSVMSFSLYVAGAAVRQFDPLFGDGGEGDPLPEEAGLLFGDESHNPRALALTLSERLTGQEISREWLLERRRPTYGAAGPPDLP